ncbi:LSM domain protein [Staphylococcus kloosii]|jgi:indole-3-glycerol phosphate synthase|uniref:LSM domain protein n=1 Tax=Staphylococcus kloosii TaxID=29384 RepID=UPI0018A01ED8|nr:LSM domain protein [Staphylococcus kloosii]MBF7029935.1 LSM domain protein [Staphylococcus kloosii]
MKYKLWEYVGKNVELIDINNRKFIGFVVNFEDDTENNENMCSIDLETTSLNFVISESGIKKHKRDRIVYTPIS